MPIKKLVSLFLFVFLIIFTACFCREQYDLSICCIFRDDSKYLQEWIEFHKKQGVQHFYLYNNLSQDNYKHYLKKHLENNDVTLIDWPFESNSGATWGRIQCDSYMHCVDQYGIENKWIAFIDTDEYLFSPLKINLAKVLKDYESYGAVCVNWVMYGSSNIEKIEDGDTILDKLLYRDEYAHTSIKTIARPECVLNNENMHYFLYKDNNYAVCENKKHVSRYFSEYPSVSILRLNHYWSRDLTFLKTIKSERRKLFTGSYDMEELLRRDKLYNVMYEPIYDISIN